MTVHEEDAHRLRLIRLAKAIAGPYLPVHGLSKFSLEELRDVRWSWLSTQEQDAKIMQAQAVLDELAKENQS